MDLSEYTSPGAAATASIEDTLLKMQLAARQRQQDDLNRRNIESEIATREAQRRTAEESAKALADEREQVALKAKLAASKEYVDQAGPNAILSPSAQKIVVPEQQAQAGMSLASKQIGPGGVTDQPSEPIQGNTGSGAPQVMVTKGTPEQLLAQDFAQDPPKDEKDLRRRAYRRGVPPLDVEKMVKEFRATDGVAVFQHNTKSGQLERSVPGKGWVPWQGDLPAGAKVLNENPGNPTINLSPGQLPAGWDMAGILMRARAYAKGDSTSAFAGLPFGNAKTPITAAITTWASRYNPNTDDFDANKGDKGPDLSANRATRAAIQSALTQRTTASTAIKTAAKIANDNLDLVLHAKGGARTDAKFVNAFVNNAIRGLAPAGDLTDMEVKIYTAIREYSKAASGAYGAQGLTDSATHEAEALLSSAQSHEALDRAIKAMRQDLGNIIKEHDSAIADLQGHLKGNTAPKNPTDPNWGMQ